MRCAASSSARAARRVSLSRRACVMTIATVTCAPESRVEHALLEGAYGVGGLEHDGVVDDTARDDHESAYLWAGAHVDCGRVSSAGRTGSLDFAGMGMSCEGDEKVTVRGRGSELALNRSLLPPISSRDQNTMDHRSGVSATELTAGLHKVHLR